MIDNLATTSRRGHIISYDSAEAPNNNNYNSSPVRHTNKRPLVVPNAPRISRRRVIPAPQLSAARRNIFYFIVNEE